MDKNFAEIAFTPAVKDLQEFYGSRHSYDRMEKSRVLDGLTDNEKRFIAHSDSFFMATNSESGFPYIQHRGGPKGFVKVLDSKRIGFIDFTGNMQYISAGNLATNNKVSLIMVDYPSRSRLKVYATAETLEIADNRELYEQLDLPGYAFKAERIMVLNIEAFDWNCPQHITPRYTAEEIDSVINSRHTS
ncbi:MAG: pyridoxamine 5'-phosphate oxidase family protein [Chitinophagaceae bacterium]|nr:MAG: pyridoxamine 5'-phosphate oxidase family protein [Chitinophagaceae bacterium]